MELYKQKLDYYIITNNQYKINKYEYKIEQYGGNNYIKYTYKSTGISNLLNTDKIEIYLFNGDNNDNTKKMIKYLYDNKTSLYDYLKQILDKDNINFEKISIDNIKIIPKYNFKIKILDIDNIKNNIINLIIKIKEFNDLIFYRDKNNKQYDLIKNYNFSNTEYNNKIINIYKKYIYLLNHIFDIYDKLHEEYIIILNIFFNNKIKLLFRLESIDNIDKQFKDNIIKDYDNNISFINILCDKIKNMTNIKTIINNNNLSNIYINNDEFIEKDVISWYYKNIFNKDLFKTSLFHFTLILLYIYIISNNNHIFKYLNFNINDNISNDNINDMILKYINYNIIDYYNDKKIESGHIYI